MPELQIVQQLWIDFGPGGIGSVTVRGLLQQCCVLMVQIEKLMGFS